MRSWSLTRSHTIYAIKSTSRLLPVSTMMYLRKGLIGGIYPFNLHIFGIITYVRIVRCRHTHPIPFDRLTI